MKESLIFFALLTIIVIGFLQAFIGMDKVDDNRAVTGFILQAMANSVMQSPDFGGFENFAPPFGIVLYYIFTFVVMVGEFCGSFFALFFSVCSGLWVVIYTGVFGVWES